MIAGARAAPLLVASGKHAPSVEIVPCKEYNDRKSDHDKPPEWVVIGLGIKKINLRHHWMNYKFYYEMPQTGCRSIARTLCTVI